MKRYVARLLTFPGNPRWPDAAALMREIPDGDLAELLTTECMVKQGGEDGSISNVFERFLWLVR